MRRMIPLLLLCAACTPAPSGTVPATNPAAVTAAPASSSSLAGTYLLRQMNGRSLPAPSPQEPNVEVSRGVQRLGEDGTFTLTLTGRRNEEPTPGDQQMSGAYTVSGDVLALTMQNGGGPRFTFTRSGATLTLRDDMGVTYLLERQ